MSNRLSVSLRSIAGLLMVGAMGSDPQCATIPWMTRVRKGLTPHSPSRPFADGLGALAGRRRVARQMIVDFETAHLLGDVRMAGRRPLPGVGQGAVEEMHLARPSRAGVGHGGAAVGAEIALNARRGFVNGRLALQIAELLEPDADIGGDRRRHSAPAALAMAVHHPFGLACELILDGAALAAACGGDRLLAGGGCFGSCLAGGSSRGGGFGGCNFGVCGHW